MKRVIASTLLCALAFNLTFFWQELWLVIPKALTPGLHPILYHNDHSWSGESPIVELLQGTGAIATLVSGLIFLGLRGKRLFFFWMAFEGLYQSLSQLAIGTLLPGNDVGRALGYLHIDQTGKWALLALAGILMASAGGALAKIQPPVWETLLAGLLAVIFIVPFRLPRNMIEVLLIPVIVQFCGLIFLLLGALFINSSRTYETPPPAKPAMALLVLLAVFQLILRPGIAF
jgi:hypothetical protein